MSPRSCLDYARAPCRWCALSIALTEVLRNISTARLSERCVRGVRLSLTSPRLEDGACDRSPCRTTRGRLWSSTCRVSPHDQADGSRDSLQHCFCSPDVRRRPVAVGFAPGCGRGLVTGRLRGCSSINPRIKWRRSLFSQTLFHRTSLRLRTTKRMAWKKDGADALLIPNPKRPKCPQTPLLQTPLHILKHHPARVFTSVESRPVTQMGTRVEKNKRPNLRTQY